MSGKVSDEGFSIAALGRPFHLGTLYDCRSDKILPGITLWDKSTLEERSVQQLETADFEIIVSDSLDDKSSALDVSARIKLSFLCGLIDVSGSGKYLDNRKSSNHQERVSLKYKCTVRSEEMTMDQLGKGKIEHPEVFDHGTATHVVTGITYGGNAFFVFDREKSSSSHDKNIGGNLQAMIKKIPKMEVSGKGHLKISEDEKNEVHKFSCKYFGDFKPKENPSSYEQAVRLYKELPSLTGENGKNAVPIKVYLYPLSLLDRKASRIVRDISANLVREAEEVLEEIHELDVKCNDLFKTQAIQKFRGIKSEIQTFKSRVQTYKLGFQTEISQILPHIRGGGKDEGELAHILKKKEASPFSSNALKSWLEIKEEQVKILSQYTKLLSKVKFASEPGDLISWILSPDFLHILCFSVLLPKCNRYLQNMQRYISDGQQSGDLPIIENMNFIPFTEVDNETTMMEKARLFKDFYEANKDNLSTGFIIAEESSDSDDFQAKIRYYAKGKLVHEDFEIPGIPRNVTAVKEKITHGSIFVKWDKPLHGASRVKKFNVKCESLSGCVQSVSECDDHSDNSTYITGLEAGREYQISIQSICDAGVSLWSEVSKPVKTRPTSPPGKPQIYQLSYNTVGIEWAKPSTIGSECSFSKYVVKQQEKGSDWYEMNLKSEDECKFICVVKSNVAYRFKIYCDCGQMGESLDSEVSGEFMIPMQEYLKLMVREKSKKLQGGKLEIFELGVRNTFPDHKENFQKYEFGSAKDGIPEKIFLIVGATGSGKTTLINGIINYIFGVEWKDNFRFKMITEPKSDNQAESQTTQISSYTIHHQDGLRVSYTLTIIDTPGFGDVQGIERDKEITEQIRCFFTAEGAKGIDHIDAVGFVAQSSLARLTPTQRYIFDQTLSLFGKDIEENIFLLLTFADSGKPQVLSAIKEANFPCNKFFKFNNSSLYASNSKAEKEEDDEDGDVEDDDDGDDDDDGFEVYWQRGEKSFNGFLKKLNTANSKSLSLTQDVLNERKKIQASLAGLQSKIQTGLSKLEQLKTEEHVLRTHQATMDKNADFTYTVDEEIMGIQNNSDGVYALNCLKCPRTCHFPCQYSPIGRHLSIKYLCSVISPFNYCTVCKCSPSHHRHLLSRYVPEVKQVIKTSESLRARYQQEDKNIMTAEFLIQKIKEEFETVELETRGLVDEVRKSLDRLNEIALKPGILSTGQYIAILIQKEKSQQSPGWEARVSQLEKLKDQEQYITSITDASFDPFQEVKGKD